jgi:hypothetical protein
VVPDDANILPEDPAEAVHNIFYFAALADKQRGTLYTDDTGALSVILLDSHQYFFVAYKYATKYIFAEPIANVTHATIVDTVDGVFTDLMEKGFKPRLNVTDNQAKGPLKSCMS